jgi:O-antigen/teichoic acid export membrane protein
MVFPIMMFVSISAGEWVGLAFNASYSDLKPMIVLLSVVGAFQAVTSPVGVLYILKERTRTMFINSVIIALVIIATFLLSSIYFSIYWVVLSYMLVWLLIVMPLTVSVAYKIFNFGLTDFIKSISPAILCTLFASASYLFIKNYFAGLTVICLVIGFFVFTAVYVASYLIMTRGTDKSVSYYLQFMKNKK